VLIRLILFFCLSNHLLASSVDPMLEPLNQELVSIDDPLKYNDFFNRVQKLSLENPEHEGLLLYSSVARLLQSIEGITWLEEGFYRQSDFLYSIFVSFMRSTYSPDYVIGTHVRKYGRYFTEPHMKMGQFANLSDLQDHLIKVIMPALDHLISVLDRLSRKEKIELVLDQHVLVGFVAKERTTNKEDWFFIPEDERFRILRAPHFALMKSQMELLAGVVSYFSAYNLDLFPKYIDYLIQTVTWRSLKKILLFRKYVEPLTTQDKVEALKKDKFKNFLTLTKPLMTLKALEYWRNSTLSRRLALEKFQKMNRSSSQDLWDVDEFKWRAKTELPMLRLREEFLNAAVHGEDYKITVPATRYTFKLRPKQLFMITDYKSLLAKTFYGEAQRKTWEIDHKVAPHPLYGEFTVWDFNYGKPVTYLDPTFNFFLPEANDENYLELIKSLRLYPAIAPFVNLLPLH